MSEINISLIYIIDAVAMVSLFLLVLFKAERSKTTNLLLLMLLNLSIMSIMYIPLSYADDDLSLFIIRTSHIFVIFLPILYVNFIARFLGIYEKLKKIIIIGYIFSSLLIVFVYSSLFDKSVVDLGQADFMFEPGPIFHLFIAVEIIYIILLFYIQFKHFRIETNTIKKAQLKLLLISSLIGFLGGYSIFLRWYNIRVPLISGIAIYIYALILVYTMITRRLFDVKLVLRNYSVYIASIATVMLAGGLLDYYFTIYIQERYYANMAFLAVSLVAFPYIKNFYHNISNKYFFTSLYDSQDIIRRFTERLRLTIDTKEVNKIISEIILMALHVKKIGIYLYNEKESKLVLNYSGGEDIMGLKQFNAESRLVEFFEKRRVVVVEEYADREDDLIYGHKISRQEDIKIILPLQTGDQLVGLIAVGGKESKDIFNSEDLRLLEIISTLSASVIRNSQLFQEAKAQNTYLNELVNIKNDFLRVINHQLNTPLSIIRMGLSSYRENVIGSEEAIKYAESGVNRLASTLDTFWEAYNLESGGGAILPEKTDAIQIVKNVVNEKLKSEMVKKKELKIEVNWPSKTLKKVFCDAKMVARALAILVDNSIRYTNKGGIGIYFKEETVESGKFVKIFIKDTGAGIKQEEQEKIFNKFFRSPKAISIFPDGSGLGLYIAKNIIQSNGGEIKLEESEENIGSTFSVTLPIEELEA
jgi:signal transduction histidine kinase